jgi:hypothetical protein
VPIGSQAQAEADRYSLCNPQFFNIASTPSQSPIASKPNRRRKWTNLKRWRSSNSNIGSEDLTMTNLDRMRKDIDRLTSEGNQLLLRMVFDLFPNEVTKARGMEKDELKKLLPAFNESYQRWYSEALAMLSVVLPDRVADFKAYYQLPKPPKELVSTTYTISDYLRGTTVTIGLR